MRRYPVVKLILMVIALSLIAAPANAAAYHPASSTNPASQASLGSVCRTVHALRPFRTGVICIGLAIHGGRFQYDVQAVASFKSDSGKLAGVSVRHLVLLLRGMVAESGVGSGKNVGGTFYLSTRQKNLWDGRPMPPRPGRAGLYDACMYWAGGGYACTGAHWLYSKTENVSP